MQAKSAGGGVTSLTSGHRPGLVSGSREGVITSWAVDSGIALQSIDISQVQPSELQKRLPAKGEWLACLSSLNNVSDNTIDLILCCLHAPRFHAGPHTFMIDISIWIYTQALASSQKPSGAQDRLLPM